MAITATWPTALKEFIAGTKLLAADLNTYVSNALSYMYTYGGAQGTGFPSSPLTNQKIYRTDYRAWFTWDGSAWRQTSVGMFTSAFPGSPVTGLQVWRDDFAPQRLYYYNGSTWLLLVGSVGVDVYNSAAISVANTTAQALTFNNEREDTDAMHSTSSNTSRLTCTVPGAYIITGAGRFAPASGGIRYLQIRLNGSTFIASNSLIAAVSDNHDLTVVRRYRLALNDYVELIAYQNTGGALNIGSTGNFTPEFGMQWLGA